MNLPNLLTFIRFGLIPLYFLAFFSESPHSMKWALGILLVAGLTDLLDGYIARKYNLITPLGIILDPLADKLMMLSVVLSLIFADRISWIAAALLFFRDGIMIAASAFFHFRDKQIVPATWWGKSTTVLYYFTVVGIMFMWPFADLLLWGTILLSFVTSFVYLTKFRAMNR